MPAFLQILTIGTAIDFIRFFVHIAAWGLVSATDLARPNGVALYDFHVHISMLVKKLISTFFLGTLHVNTNVALQRWHVDLATVFCFCVGRSISNCTVDPQAQIESYFSFLICLPA